MADVFTKEKRSEVMSRIRGSGNKDTELAFVALLRHHRIRGWRRKQLVLGRPDFVFYGSRLAVFIDGCFWHGCPKHATLPKGNRGFWRRKLRANMLRDRRVSRALRRDGWSVLRIWEHDLAKRGEHCVRRLVRGLSRRHGPPDRRQPSDRSVHM